MSFSMRPAPPAPVDIVTAHEAAGLFAETERRLAELEQERIEAEAAAEAAERRIREEPIDPDLHGWPAEQFRRFTRQLRAEHESEMQALLTAAEERAGECVARARREADVIISYGRAIYALRAAERTPAAPDGADDPEPSAHEPAVSTPVDVLTASDATAPTSVVPSVLPPDVASAPDSRTPLVTPADTPIDDPVVVPPAPPVPLAPPIAAEPEAPAPPPAAPPPPVATEVSSATGDVGTPEHQAPAPPDDAHDDFWPEPERRRALHRLPRLAILQVLAVLVILVVVLLRIG
jgi:hypothetical protein